MITENPHFGHIERAPAEICNLLQQIPQGYIGRAEKKNLSMDEIQLLDAARKHCQNHSQTLLDGLEALGSMLFSAADNKDFPPTEGDLMKLASLIQALSIEARCLQDYGSSFNSALIVQTGSEMFLSDREQ